MDEGIRRFACMQCGKCCDRSPEVELSEAAALSDVFVFRLMFRLYSMPHAPSGDARDRAELFYEKRRLLSAHAARTYTKRVMREGKPIERIQYLMISALALQTRPGACAALKANRCAIYDRRPVGCRSVPFHYSRPVALAVQDFDAFVSTPRYACDVGANAPVVLQGGRLIHKPSLQARAEALSLSQADRHWKQAIFRRMKRGDTSLPRLADVEATAGIGVLTTSMLIAWEIASDEGLIGSRDALVRAQFDTIGRELAAGGCTGADLVTLTEMATEYRQALEREGG
jgi:Fe-S-cluster containining protein